MFYFYIYANPPPDKFIHIFPFNLIVFFVCKVCIAKHAVQLVFKTNTIGKCTTPYSRTRGSNPNMESIFINAELKIAV